MIQVDELRKILGEYKLDFQPSFFFPPINFHQFLFFHSFQYLPSLAQPPPAPAIHLLITSTGLPLVVLSSHLALFPCKTSVNLVWKSSIAAIRLSNTLRAVPPESKMSGTNVSKPTP
jgi:hypothetical protein